MRRVARSTPILVLLLLAVPAVVLAKIPFRAKIEDGRGMAGVRLGFSEKAVKAEWGKPITPCRTAPNRVRVCNWQRGSGQSFTAVLVELIGNRVVYVRRVAGDDWKTNKGAHIGTKLRRLRGMYPGMKFSQTCVIDRRYVGEIGKRSGVTSFRFVRKSDAQSGRFGVDSIAIYDARKIDWDGLGPEGPRRPPNRATCPTMVG